MSPRAFKTVIVGGGPAGMAPLVSAARDGRLRRLLGAGVALVEAGPTIGGGRLGRYAITSDSTAETFLTAVRDHADPLLLHLAETPLCRTFAGLGRGCVPLREAGEFAEMIGEVLASAITDAGGAVMTRHEARWARRNRSGGWTVALRRMSDGAEVTIAAEALLLATGGTQTPSHVETEWVAGRALLPRYTDKLVLSEDVLQPAGLAALQARLARRRLPKVTIVGGSTSALAAACLLLRQCPDTLAASDSITVLHRRPLRLFYPNAEAALAEGYTDFGPDDICPISGFVYRFAGMRLDSRDLLLRLLGVGGAMPEPRVRLHRIGAGLDARAHALLDEADVVIAALGYRPRALPLFDDDGSAIRLRGVTVRGALVDKACRVCDIAGNPVPGVFGIGLAAGFAPSGPLGGEPSFVGQTNGLWLWQNAIGSLVVDGMLATHAARPAVASLPAPETTGSMPDLADAALSLA